MCIGPSYGAGAGGGSRGNSALYPHPPQKKIETVESVHYVNHFIEIFLK